MPDIASVGWSRLDRLSRAAHEFGAIRTESNGSVWRRCAGRGSTMVREWPLDFGGWPDRAVLTDESYAPQLDEGNGEISLSDSISLRGDLELLRYVMLHLSAYFEEAVELSKSSFMRQHVAPATETASVLRAYEAALTARSEAEGRFHRVIGLIDRIVERGYGLSQDLRTRIEMRMNEFPLNENANKPRLPWEESKKPRGRQFAEGERYRER